MQIQVTLDGEVDHLLHPVRSGRLSINMEFADPTVIAAGIFFLDELENRRIVEPGLDVAAHAIGTDERHDLELGPLCVHQLMCAFVGSAGRDDAGDAVAAEYVAHLVEGEKRLWLLVVMQMSVEDCESL